MPESASETTSETGAGPASALSRTIGALARGSRSTDPVERSRAARLALAWSSGLLVGPGLPLGGLYAVYGRPLPHSPLTLGLLLALALGLGAWVLRLARQAAADPAHTRPQADLLAGMQAGAAPGIAALLACSCLAQWPAALALAGLAALLYGAAWVQLQPGGWLRPAETALPEEGRQEKRCQDGKI